MASTDQIELRDLLLAESLNAKTKLLTEIIRTKQLHKASKTSEFSAFIDQLGGYGKTDGIEKLKAISSLCKVGLMVRSLEQRIAPILRNLLEHPLPNLRDLLDPDERFYVAGFWRFTIPTWAATYLAESIVTEESAESVREELCAGLLAATAKYSSAIALLGKTLSTHRFDTEKPADSMARRVRRTISALQKAIFLQDPLDPGEDFGGSIRDLIRRVFGNGEFPADSKVTRDTALAILDFVSSVSRLRLLVAFDSETYGPLFSLRDWFQAEEWDTLLKSDVARRFRNDIAGALEVSARSGRFDGQLINLLKLACSDNEKFEDEISHIVDRNLGLPVEAIAWLQGRTIRAQTAMSEESVLARVESLIAQLMRLRMRTDSLAEEVTEEVLPSLASFQSVPSRSIELLVKTLSESSRTIMDLARERELRFFGVKGEVVEFSNLEHEITGGSQSLIRKVMIAEPGILANSRHGRQRVVIKALVRSI